MGGLTKFLLGGILGAIFGFLVSPRRGKQVYDALFGGTDREGTDATPIAPKHLGVELQEPAPPVQTYAPAAPPHEPAFETASSLASVVEPVSEAAPVVEIEPEAIPWPRPAAEPAGRPEPAARLDSVAEWEQVRATPAPLIDQVAEPVAEEAPPVAEYFVPVAETGPPAAEPAAPVVGFEHVVEPASLVEEAPPAEPAVSAESMPLAQETPSPAPAPPVESAPSVEEVSLAGVGMAAEGVPLAIAAPEEQIPGETAAESVVVSETMAVAGAMAEDMASPARGATPLSADELRARIEETRRRIREELEQPFREEIPTEPEHQLQVPAPAAEEWSPAADRTTQAPAAEAPESEPAEIPEAPSAAEPEVVREVEAATIPLETGTEKSSALDYEAIKIRIEKTRGRLKAKAFDAMMSGEAALLGREESETPAAKSPELKVDRDIDETIESSLTEERP